MAAVIASRGRSAGSLPAYGSRTPIIRAEPRRAGQGKAESPDVPTSRVRRAESLAGSKPFSGGNSRILRGAGRL